MRDIKLISYTQIALFYMKIDMMQDKGYLQFVTTYHLKPQYGLIFLLTFCKQIRKWKLESLKNGLSACLFACKSLAKPVFMQFFLLTQKWKKKILVSDLLGF